MHPWSLNPINRESVMFIYIWTCDWMNSTFSVFFLKKGFQFVSPRAVLWFRTSFISERLWSDSCVHPASFQPFFSLLTLLKILIILISNSVALYRGEKSSLLWLFVWRFKKKIQLVMINYCLLFTWMNINESNPSLPSAKQPISSSLW